MTVEEKAKAYDEALERARQRIKDDSNCVLIHIDVFYRDLLVVWGNKEETREALLHFHDEDKVTELLDEFELWDKGRTVYSTEHNAFFVWIPEKPKTAQDAGFIVHELFHSTYAVMCNVGISLSECSEEVFAYTMGYLAEKIFKSFSISFSSCQQSASKQTQQQTSLSLGSLDSSED